MSRIVQLFGAADNMMAAPEIPNVEKWMANNPRIYRIKYPIGMTTWTRWINVHSLRHIELTYYNEFVRLLRNYPDNTKPLYFREVDPKIPGCVLFPRFEIQEFFRLDEFELERFFVFSGGWMLAMAIWEHCLGKTIKEIQLWGFKLERDRQYDYERPAMHYWIGRARQAGIKVFIPEGVDLCRTDKLYGYETT